MRTLNMSTMWQQWRGLQSARRLRARGGANVRNGWKADAKEGTEPVSLGRLELHAKPFIKLARQMAHCTVQLSVCVTESAGHPNDRFLRHIVLDESQCAWV